MKLKALYLSLITLVAAQLSASELISPDNENLQYTGRVDFSDVQSPRITWAGSIIKANFTGNHLGIIMNDDRGENFFNVIIDGNDTYPYVLQCKEGEQHYTVATQLGEGPHSLEIYKRTEGSNGGTHFLGLEIEDDAELLPPPARPTRRIAFFGDSITSAMGNEGADNGADHLPSEKNNYLGYAAFTTRNLEAESHIISMSGIGIMVSWFDFIMPQYYDQLDGHGNNDTQWDFSLWTPDVVVINLFQNDCWLIDREKRLDPMPTEAQRIQAYVDFVESILKEYPDAYYVCALGSMDATQEGSKWPGYITSAVEQLQTAHPELGIDTCFFPFTGYTQHPRVQQHRDNAAMLTKLIREKMDW